MILRAKLIEARMADAVSALTLAQAQEWAATTDKRVWVETRILDPHDLPRWMRLVQTVEDALETLLEAQQ